jgi:putative aminopeptidase FrvX
MSATLLTQILSQPTAPYREEHVQRVIRDTFTKNAVPHFSDPVGNIVVGARDSDDYKRKLRSNSREPVRFYIAHTDHPGFHGVEWLGAKKLKVTWFGGGPNKHLRGADVWTASKRGWEDSGLMTRAEMGSAGMRILGGEVTFKTEKMRQRFENPKDIFGGFGFSKAVWSKDKILYTKAADDLVGVYCITELAIRLWKKETTGQNSFLAVLTRAEEVGFIGAVAHFELGWLKEALRPIVCVSLEASRTLRGAEIGKGPVVRLGDRATVFDARASQVLTMIASKLLPLKHQRRLMDGGTCEATAATAYGFPAIGISVPLGNYHNQSLEGGPQSRGPSGPAPEFVHRNDIKGMLTLCEGLLEENLPWEAPWTGLLTAFRQSRHDASELLSLS